MATHQPSDRLLGLISSCDMNVAAILYLGMCVVRACSSKTFIGIYTCRFKFVYTLLTC